MLAHGPGPTNFRWGSARPRLTAPFTVKAHPTLTPELGIIRRTALGWPSVPVPPSDVVLRIPGHFLNPGPAWRHGVQCHDAQRDGGSTKSAAVQPDISNSAEQTSSLDCASASAEGLVHPSEDIGTSTHSGNGSHGISSSSTAHGLENGSSRTARGLEDGSSSTTKGLEDGSSPVPASTTSHTVMPPATPSGCNGTGLQEAESPALHVHPGVADPLAVAPAIMTPVGEHAHVGAAETAAGAAAAADTATSAAAVTAAAAADTATAAADPAAAAAADSSVFTEGASSSNVISAEGATTADPPATSPSSSSGSAIIFEAAATTDQQTEASPLLSTPPEAPPIADTHASPASPTGTGVVSVGAPPWAAAAAGVAAFLSALSGMGGALSGVIARATAAVVAAAAAALAVLGGWIPGWSSAQNLRRLREAADQEPRNVEVQVALLAELNRQGASGAREVLERLSSPEYPSSPAIVVERLRALVISGKLPEYVAEDAAPSSEDHKSLSQLLKEMKQQISGEQRDDLPGSSMRRPLHIKVDVGSAKGFQKPAGPVQILGTLMAAAVAGLGLSFVWLIGSQAVRRAQAGNTAVTVVTSTSSAGPVTNGATTGSGSGGGGSPSVEPKEYKKDELPEKSIRTFKDVKGCDEAKEELMEVVEFLKDPAKFTRLGAKLPKGVLLTGPPGTGKTLLARAVAGEAGVPFFYRSGSEFEELYVGVGSRRMRALFQAAKKKAPCIVFIDEIDAIGGNRKHWENHSRKTLNQLLVEMDGFEASDNVIVMAATNLPETLDPALTRPGRFDRQVVVPVPDVRGRQEILDHYLDDKPIAQDIDRHILARQTQGFTGADIANLVNEAAILAAKQNTEVITARQVDSAFDKILMGVERRSVRRTEEGRRHTAYHESGHALVALNTPGASPIHKATIMHRGDALGMVTQVGRDDEFSINHQQMQARILVALGGTVAEEIIFGRDGVTSGATSDLKTATSMARHMVMDCGLNEAVGPMYVHDEKTLSEDTRQKVDQEVRRMLCEAREAVKNLLQEKIQDLHKLSTALIEYETLTASEIKQVLEGTFSKPAPPVITSAPQDEGPDAESSTRDASDLSEPEAAQVAIQSKAIASRGDDRGLASLRPMSQSESSTTSQDARFDYMQQSDCESETGVDSMQLEMLPLFLHEGSAGEKALLVEGERYTEQYSES